MSEYSSFASSRANTPPPPHEAAAAAASAVQYADVPVPPASAGGATSSAPTWSPVPPSSARTTRTTTRPSTRERSAGRDGGWSLTSRAHPQPAYGISRPVPRYDPRAVLAQRAALKRSSSPPRYQRQVRKASQQQQHLPPQLAAYPLDTNSFVTDDMSARDATPGADPLQRWQHAFLESGWRAPTTWSSMHNTPRVHKSKLALFSTPAPSPLPPSPQRFHPVGVPVPLAAHEVAFRPPASSALDAYLEAHWSAGGTQLHQSAHNALLTRAQRRYFDAPQREEPQPEQKKLQALLLLHETEVERATRAQLAAETNIQQRQRARKGSSPARELARAARATKLLSQSSALAMQEAQMQLLASSPEPSWPDEGRPSQRRGHASPERVMRPRPKPDKQLLQPSNLNGLLAPYMSSFPSSFPAWPSRPSSSPQLVASTASRLEDSSSARMLPSPMALHPHSRYFRLIPKSSVEETRSDLRRERGWNDRHQLDDVIDGW